MFVVKMRINAPKLSNAISLAEQVNENTDMDNQNNNSNIYFYQVSILNYKTKKKAIRDSDTGDLIRAFSDFKALFTYFDWRL